MKVVILAGGLGTRISEYTKNIPKPMIKVGKYPLIVHIIKHYLKYGYNEFYIALGYKGNVIQNYFKKNSFKCKINLIKTGINTMTGGRLKRLKKYLGNEDFFLTYGDGVSNVNLDKLVRFHKNNKKLVTLTAVRPPARFGALKLNGQ
jgi:glucose-1-phosphate cytidylyltransferase